MRNVTARENRSRIAVNKSRPKFAFAGFINDPRPSSVVKYRWICPSAVLTEPSFLPRFASSHSIPSHVVVAFFEVATGPT